MKKTVQRNILMFVNGRKSPHTRNVYQNRLNIFLKYSGIGLDPVFTFDELFNIPILQLKERIEDHIICRKSCGLVRSTINNDICDIKHFFRIINVV